MGSSDASLFGTKGTKVDLPMPHNSLIIMHGDCQESWTHGVPRLADSSIKQHGHMELVRISLTFRHHRPEIAQEQNNVMCRYT